MMEMSNARLRYRNDAVFARLVDMLRYALRESHITPSEAREALLLAAYCEEVENPSPVAIRIETLGKELAMDVLEYAGRKPR